MLSYTKISDELFGGYKFVPNIALNILILKSYPLFLLNSSFIGDLIFLLLSLAILRSENIDFIVDIGPMGLKVERV